ncbi:hypothetical protein [Pseudomonas phage D6]|nr:hypothetical protein [Pseudomonas phage D6]
MEPITVVVPLKAINFTAAEVGEFIQHHTGRLPARMNELEIIWHLNQKMDRWISIRVAGTEYVTQKFQPHYRENLMQVCQWWLDKPDHAAAVDVKRFIALGLTEAYKAKIQGLWTR